MTINDKGTPSVPDIKRLKWIDPNDKSKFHRKPLGLVGDSEAEPVLENILKLADAVFDDISVLQQSPETTARGATQSRDTITDLIDETAHLRRAEQELWNAYQSLQAKRNVFVKSQLESLVSLEENKKLRLHLGSAQFHIDGWINIDAGGGDLAINVNWGLPFESGSVEFVYTSHMLEHLRFLDQAPVLVQEILRVLQPGGVARFVVPDIEKLLKAYVERNRDYFAVRQKFYPINEGFLNDGIASLDYVLLYSGVGPQTLNYNHKFGYDAKSLSELLLSAGFQTVEQSSYMGSKHPELKVDNNSFDASVLCDEEHCSLFVDATKALYSDD